MLLRPAGGSIARAERQDHPHRGGSGGSACASAGAPPAACGSPFAGTETLAASPAKPAAAGQGRGRVQRQAGLPAHGRGGPHVGPGAGPRDRGAGRGKLVEIQYFEQASRRWRPVLVTRTDDGGRFRASYRFRYITGRAAIRLRAVALPEAGWPYAPGASSPRIVRVHG